MIRLLVSWPAIVAVTLIYWASLFAVVRFRGRRAFLRALDEASAASEPGEPFDVLVPVKVRPIRDVAILLAAPVALLALRLFMR
jgi:hypothetical protein